MHHKQKLTSFSYTTLALKASVSLLLLLYASVYLLPPGLLPHSEHEHLADSVHIDEEDPCHLAIYHPGSEGSCSHKYHFTQELDKCHLCDLVLARQIINTESMPCPIHPDHSCLEIQEPDALILQFVISLASRGPPSSLTV